MGQVFLETDNFSKDVRVKKYLDGYSLIREGREEFLGEVYRDDKVLVSDLTLIEVHDILTKKFSYSETEAHHLIKNSEIKMSKEEKELEAGCYFQSWEGIYIGEGVIALAGEYGFEYKEEENSVDYEHYHDLWTDAETHLNDFVPDGHYFGPQEHDCSWGVWEIEEDED